MPCPCPKLDPGNKHIRLEMFTGATSTHLAQRLRDLSIGFLASARARACEQDQATRGEQLAYQRRPWSLPALKST